MKRGKAYHGSSEVISHEILGEHSTLHGKHPLRSLNSKLLVFGRVVCSQKNFSLIYFSMKFCSDDIMKIFCK